MMRVAHTPAQRRLRALLVSSGMTEGAAWGATGTALALDSAARAALTMQGATALEALPSVLLLLSALPLGALIGAPGADFVSHAFGRRPAFLGCALLVVLGAGAAAAEVQLLRLVGIGTVGLGLGGYAVVVPKLAHELAEHGHRRLMPRVRATAPAGAALAILAGGLGGLLGAGQGAIAAWMVVVLGAVVSLLLALTLPETPHWYAAQGRVEAAYVALRRMLGSLEAAVGIDWVMMDTGTLGEQHPIGRGDLSIARVRRTVIAGLLLELVQALPLGLAALCLGPALMTEVAQPSAGGQAALPIWLAAVLALAWAVTALLGARRRGDHLAYAWILGGTGLAACGITLLALADAVHGAGLIALLIVVDALAVVGQFVAVVPACT
ncbi:MFS transporter, partial [Actinomyces sp. MRS3W]|uniref:MFS transporter n=1 Tax=Actinomyces sp. MRS3W TaxID=2800796 RepID=UPI0028FD2339